MNSQTLTMTETQPAKFSRYRSVRRAGPTVDEQPPPPPSVATDTVTRAPSRYRRPTQSSPHGAPPLPIQTSGIPSRSPPQNSTTSSPRAHVEAQTSPVAQRYHAPRNRRDHAAHDQHAQARPPTAGRDVRPSTATRPMTAQSRTYDDAREEARMILEGEYDRLQRLKDVQKQKEKKLKAAQEAQAAELQRQKQVEELQKERQAAELLRQKQAEELQRQRQAEELKQKQAEEAEAARVADASARHKVSDFVDAPKAQVVRRPTQKGKRFITAPQNMVRQQTVKASSPENKITMVPVPLTSTFDAPVSAVNAGERRVEVRMSGAGYGIKLPVTPTTTVKDLLNSASVVMSEKVDPRTAILVESFSQCGLERPLRRYEHIRDIMNSWDADDQNHLTVLSEDECMAKDLDKKDAPVSPPGEVELHMFHSCKLGKWDKRWVILRSDGQVTVSKHQNDGDGTNICHLSDFDVYTPTRKQLKRIKAPKKICFAVKSQQKSAMFLEGTNFVHFFATSDKQVADRWYSSVQSWRSWYLANVMGEGAPQVQAKDTSSPLDARPTTSASVESVPYQLGSFQPLLDFNIGDLTFGDSAKDGGGRGVKGHNSRPSNQSLDFGGSFSGPDQRRISARHQRAPPSSYPTKLLDEARNNVDLGLDLEERAFTGGGLLARSTSRKSQTSNGRYSSDEQAFTGGGLLARSTSRRTQGGNTSSGGSKGKPLVDLAENSEFTDGSLLRQLQSWAGSSTNDTEPKIDRQKRIEADVKVGEGY